MRTIATGSLRHATSHPGPALERVRATAVRVWRRTADIVTGTVTIVQVARMAGALNEMDDRQLARIGIRRDGIYAHAKRLVSGEFCEPGPDDTV